MKVSHRTHLSVLLLAVLASVLLFAFDLLGRGQIFPVTAVLFAFGELSLLTQRFYDRMAGGASGVGQPSRN